MDKITNGKRRKDGEADKKGEETSLERSATKAREEQRPSKKRTDLGSDRIGSERIGAERTVARSNNIESS